MQTHGHIKIIAPAKTNLCLDILERDKFSSYHKIQTIIQEIPELFNELTITIPAPIDSAPTHLTKKTLEVLRKKFPQTLTKHPSIEVKLTNQNIPDSSGLGGDSSNAAALLKALNQLWNLELTTAQLLEIAAEISMDTAFFILGGTALATNFGEKIEQLPPLKNIKFSLNPKGNPSSKTSKTTDAYASLDLNLCGHSKQKTTLALEAIKCNDIQTLLKNLHNDFTQLYPDIPKNHHLSGSGPSTFSATPARAQ
jgi:4-diphosphocytidyl-2-C-methyl-D-erythritol kinase